MIPASQAATTQAPTARCDRNQYAGHNLDCPDQVHALVGGAGHEIVDPAGQIHVPVLRMGQQIEELVQPEQDGRDREQRAKQYVCRVCRILQLVCESRAGRWSDAHSCLPTSNRQQFER